MNITLNKNDEIVMKLLHYFITIEGYNPVVLHGAKDEIWLENLQGEYKIPFKYHYLRHTYGTNLAVLNTPTHLLCNQMGHASSKVTERYYISISERGIEELMKNLEKV